MTLPATPPITMSQIYAEFGAPAGTPLGAFVRGGSWVPNTAQNASVPNAAPISMGQLCGAAKYAPMVVSAGNVTGNTANQTNAIIGSSSASVSGGLAPFTYAWSQVSGGTFTIDSPTSATTNFRRAGNPPTPSPSSGTYRCTVTDATSATAFKDITVTDNRT